MRSTFLNRKIELDNILELVSDNKFASSRFIQCETSPASGLSSFFKHSSSRFKNEYYTFYIDGSYKIPNSLSSQLLLTLYNNYPKQANLFKKYLLKKHPNDFRPLASNFLSLIPWIGSFLKDSVKDLVSLQDVPQIQSTAYSSIIAEILCPFMSQLSKDKKLILFIDNAQELDNWSVDILRSSVSDQFSEVKYIMGFVKRDEESPKYVEEVMWKMKSLGYSVNGFSFLPPNVSLIKEFSQSKGKAISDSEAIKILKITNGNVYKILAELNDNATSTNDIFLLSDLQEEILALLKIAEQPLRKSDLISIITKYSNIYIETLAEIEVNFEKLLNRGLISYSELPDSDIIVNLNHSSSPHIERILKSSAKILVKTQMIYDFFLRSKLSNEKYSQTEMALLLYRLAKIVDSQSVSKRAQTLLSLSLKMGSTESATRFIDKAVLQSPTLSLHDYFVKIAFYISIRSYREALNLLTDKQYSLFQQTRIFQILKAISYNRCRMHLESENLIKHLINTYEYKEELSLLLSYSISGQLHENNVSSARDIFYRYNEQLKDATNYGYFLRNASTALSTAETETVLVQALAEFRTHKDWFGYYSTLANLGKCRCKMGKYTQGENDLEEAYEHLAVFGFHHLHIVLNNLGLCKLYLKKNSEARTYLHKAGLFSVNAMPLIYSKINIALLDAYEGNTKEAYRRLATIESDVEVFIVDRVKQRFYLNMAFMAYAVNEPLQIIGKYCKLALEHPDRISLEFTSERINLIKKNIAEQRIYDKNMFMYFIDPCFLEYWYQNPLELLPNHILPL